MDGVSAACRQSESCQGVSTALLLDAVERAAILAGYGWLAFRLIADWWERGAAFNLLLLVSEGLVVVLISIRRNTRVISRRPSDWAFAFWGTALPLLVYPGAQGALLPVKCAAILLLLGLFVQVHAKIVLGRSMGCVPANRGLKFSGPYRLVRHPMYAGYLLSHVAFLLVNFSVWNCGVYALCYAVQIPRLLAEERLLSEDHQYADYRAQVRYRLIPGIF
jgi:protein-S-isoprenylcysteine O-methyltransferase Ste14